MPFLIFLELKLSTKKREADFFSNKGTYKHKTIALAGEEPEDDNYTSFDDVPHSSNFTFTRATGFSKSKLTDSSQQIDQPRFTNLLM